MKNFFLLLGIGALITSSFVVPSLSLSSKEMIQAHTNSTVSRYNNRRYTDRIGPFHYRRPLSFDNNKSEKRSFWSQLTRSSQETSYRPMLSRRSISKNHVPELIADDRFEIIDQKDYLVKLSSSFIKNKEGGYQHNKIPLAFRVTRTPEKYKCKQNFALCAISLDKDFKNKQEVRSSYSHITRSQLRQTRAHDFKRYPTFIESFKSILFGQENVYFLFSTYDPKDNSVIRIEAVANAVYEKEAAQVMYQVFETFRF